MKNKRIAITAYSRFVDKEEFQFDFLPSICLQFEYGEIYTVSMYIFFWSVTFELIDR